MKGWRLVDYGREVSQVSHHVIDYWRYERGGVSRTVEFWIADEPEGRQGVSWVCEGWATAHKRFDRYRAIYYADAEC